MLTPLDLRRLACRIQVLQHQSLHDWVVGDDLEFQRGLPTSGLDQRGRLPNPQVLLAEEARLSAQAEGPPGLSYEMYKNYLQICLRMEGLAAKNRPGSPQRMIRMMYKGRPY